MLEVTFAPFGGTTGDGFRNSIAWLATVDEWKRDLRSCDCFAAA